MRPLYILYVPDCVGKPLAQQALVPEALACLGPEQLLAGRQGWCGDFLFLLAPFVGREKAPGIVVVKALL